MTSWFKAKLGRIRVSTVALVAAFSVLFWVYQTFQPEPAANEAPAPAVVPPGFVPDPNYTWVPRTNVRTREPEYTTTTTTPTTSPTEPTTSPGATPTTTGPDDPLSPTTTVIDPDGRGPQSPQTFTQAPPATTAPATTPAGPVPPTTVPTQ